MKPLRVARGDDIPVRQSSLDEVLDRIYERHVSDVHRWASRLAPADEDVEDVVHEVFLIAMRRCGEFRGDSKVSTWLFRITERVIKGRRHRARARRWLFARHVEEMASEPLAVVTPLEQIELRERATRLYEALDRLPDRYRTALILYELEGLSGQSLAELLGMKPGAVWVRLHRARSRLLRELAKAELS
jgi:RNA polymerase sigma-70 factor (ECF subfamily)